MLKITVPTSNVADTPVTVILEAKAISMEPSWNVADTPVTLMPVVCDATTVPSWNVADTPVTSTARLTAVIEDENGIWEKGAVEKVMVGSYAPLKLLRVHLKVKQKFLSVVATPVSLNSRALPTPTALFPVAVAIAFVVLTVRPFIPVTVVSVPAALVEMMTEAVISPADSLLDKVFTVKAKGESTRRKTGVKPESSSSPY